MQDIIIHLKTEPKARQQTHTLAQENKNTPQKALTEMYIHEKLIKKSITPFKQSRNKLKNPMKKITLIASLALFVIGCKNADQQQKAMIKPYPVVEVGIRTITNELSYPTNIEGTVNSAVQAKISGYITQVLVDEGQTVTKGQPLFRLETNTLSQSAASAKASVEAAQIEVDKLKPLVAKNIVSPVQLTTAEANLERVKAAHNEVNASLAYSVVRAPVNGVVGAISYREGALVTANNTTLTTVSDVNDVYAYFSMNEKEYLNFLERTKGENLAEKIKNLPEVTLILANKNTYKHKGKIQTITGQIDPSTGSMQFRATFPNPEKLLTNGNSGKIQIPEVYQNEIVIPETATFEQQGKIFVYKVQNDTLKQTVITLKNRSNNYVVVQNGLQKGDWILAQGLNTARTGMLIKPQPIEMDSIVNNIKPIL